MTPSCAVIPFYFWAISISNDVRHVRDINHIHLFLHRHNLRPVFSLFLIALLFLWFFVVTKKKNMKISWKSHHFATSRFPVALLCFWDITVILPGTSICQTGLAGWCGLPTHNTFNFYYPIVTIWQGKSLDFIHFTANSTMDWYRPIQPSLFLN